MIVQKKAYLTYEEQVEEIRGLSNLLFPRVTGGVKEFFRSLPNWLQTGEKDARIGWTVVLPNPSFNLSLPYARDEVSLALAVAYGYQPEEHEIEAFAGQFTLTTELLDRPIVALSGGERMLLSLCKASALGLLTKKLCLCSPYFWLDPVNDAMVQYTLEEHIRQGGESTLLLLDGEENSTSPIHSQTKVESETLNWTLQIDDLEVVFPAEVFSREAENKRIRFITKGDVLNLKSPTLITGPNGSGKTTLAKVLSGMIEKKGNACVITKGLTGTARLLMQDTITQLFSQSIMEHFERVFSYDRERRKEAKKLYRELEDRLSENIAKISSSIIVGNKENPNTILQCKLALTVERLMSETPLLVLDEPGWCLSQPVAKEFVRVIVDAAIKKNTAVAIISHQHRWWMDIVQDHVRLNRTQDSDEVIIEQTELNPSQ